MTDNTLNLVGFSSSDSILETRDSFIQYVDNTILFEHKKGKINHFGREINLLIQAIGRFGNMPFVYISNQNMHAQVSLNDYKYLEMLPNLIGMAIVVNNEYNHLQVNFDESQFKNPAKVFCSLDDAKNWSKTLFSKEKIRK
jgi:hypothetical protein